MLRSVPAVERFIRFFSLPGCYFKIIRTGECNKSHSQIAANLLDIFWRYKTFPDHYLTCRLWEVEKSEWRYYYGSNYQALPKAKLQRTVQPAKYRILFDDKAICTRLCREAGIPTPRLYGRLSPDADYRTVLASMFERSSSASLFIKPLAGKGGQGIVIAIKAGDEIYIRTSEGITPLGQFTLASEALAFVVLAQDDRMAVFSASSVNTIRVVTMYTKDSQTIILSASMRCGVGDSFVDNWSAGGVAVGVSLDTGRLMKFAYDKKGNRYLKHPTANIEFEGHAIPVWDEIIELAKTVQDSFKDQCRMLGVDIAVRHDGRPVVIELNQRPDLIFQEQTSGPLLKDPRVLRAFGEYDLLVNDLQEDLYRSLKDI
jgi:hypothetical protein